MPDARGFAARLSGIGAARIGVRCCVALVLCALAFAGSAADRATPAQAATETFSLAAPGVSGTPLKVRVRLPPAYARDPSARYPVLYVNDGQDWDAVGFEATLAWLERTRAMRAIIVVAIDMPPDRMAAYGLSDRAAARSLVGDSRYGPIGANAQAYARWVVERLVVEVDARYRTRAAPAQRAVLGWSLGALSAFGLGWQYPDVFGTAGAFSPSFWVASDRGDAAAAQRTRLAQTMVDAGPKRAGARFWFAIGDREETDDRDGDGINDAVDDLRDLILGDGAQRGLRGLGYRVNLAADRHPRREADVAYALLRGGRHEQAAWKRMLPPFLVWAFPPRER